MRPLTRIPIILFAMLGSPLWAQATATPTGEADEAVANGDLVVTALPPPVADSAYGTQTIGGDRLRDTAAGTLEAALGAIPGFQQFRRSDSRSANISAQGINLRALGGNATSRTLLLLDGVPVADAFFGFIPFTALPVEAVARVTVTRGSGTGPFGAGALAGTISIDSIPLAQRRPVELALTAGSHTSIQGDAAIVVPLGAGYVSIEAHHDRSDGFMTTPVAQRVAASAPAAYRATSASVTAQVPVDDSTAFSARVGLFRDNRTLRFRGADSSAEGVDASLRVTGSGRWQWDALAWLQARDFSNIVVSSTSFRPTLDQRDTPTSGWGAKFELRPPVGDARTLRLGGDLRGADGDAIEDVIAASGARTLTRRAGGSSVVGGLFIEADAGVGPLLLSAGARIDRWEQGSGTSMERRSDGTVTSDLRFAPRGATIPSWRGAAAWAVTPQLTVRAAAYRGFRLPTLNELYRGFTIFPVVTRANAALDPERLHGTEIGATWQPRAGVTVSLTGFDNRVNRAIANLTIATNVRERRNIAAIAARGIELNAAADFGQWRIDGGWSYSSARVRTAPGDVTAAALNGLRPAQTPVHAGGITLGWQPVQTTLIQLGVRYTGAQFEDDRNIDRLPDATTIDAVLRHALTDRLSLELRGENLFNEDVVTRNAAGSVDLGAPRIVWLGLRWRQK